MEKRLKSHPSDSQGSGLVPPISWEITSLSPLLKACLSALLWSNVALARPGAETLPPPTLALGAGWDLWRNKFHWGSAHPVLTPSSLFPHALQTPHSLEFHLCFGGTGVRAQSFVLSRSACYHLSHAYGPSGIIFACRFMCSLSTFHTKV